MAGRPLLAFLSLILLAGGILLQLLVILSGTIQHNPINLVYFLEASTNDIPDQRNPSRWTFFAICSADDKGRNSDCGSPVPALPFDPPHRSNFNTTTGVPDGFVGTHKYFYLSRFMFAFFLVALFFAATALFTGLLALCTRIGAYLSGLNASIALFFQLLAAALMTAWTVQARKTFRSADQSATLGVKAYAFTWAAVACFFLSTMLFCAGGRAGHEYYGSSSRGGGGYFARRSKSTRSTRSNRGSFIDGHGRAVKDDYS